MNDNIHNWTCNNAVVYTSSYGLLLEVRKTVIHNQQDTWLHELTSVKLLQGTTYSISCCCQHSLT